MFARSRKAKEVHHEAFDEIELNKANTPRKIELKQLSSHMKYIFLKRMERIQLS